MSHLESTFFLCWDQSPLKFSLFRVPNIPRYFYFTNYGSRNTKEIERTVKNKYIPRDDLIDFTTQQDKIKNNKSNTLVWLISMGMETGGLIQPAFKDIPGCTSLPKSSNNLEPICNYVNVKCSWLVILRIISVTIASTVWETYATNVNLTNLKVIIFPIPLYLTVYSALFTLSLSTAFVV